MYNNTMDIMLQRQMMHNMDLYMQPVDTLNCKVKLMNEDLWNSFHKLETEMIITKSGRRMFPTLRVQLENLDPNEQYCVFVDMMPISKNRYKYSASGGWAPAGAEEAQSLNKLYLHPISPASGSQWMSQIISFSRLKLTNCTNPPEGHLVLSSMHKYEPRIIIAKTCDPMHLRWAARTTVAFHQTQFVAVTAYQNDRITKLKIDNNPFAKGFRENGQSKCKRKRIPSNDNNNTMIKKAKDDGAVNELTGNVTDRDSDSDRTSSPELTITTLSPPTPPRSYNHYASHYQQIAPQPPPPPPPRPMNFYPQYQQMYAFHPSMYSTRPIIPIPINPAYYHHAYGILPAPIVPQSPTFNKAPTPKKLTDFSIKAIIAGLT